MAKEVQTKLYKNSIVTEWKKEKTSHITMGSHHDRMKKQKYPIVQAKYSQFTQLGDFGDEKSDT